MSIALPDTAKVVRIGQGALNPLGQPFPGQPMTIYDALPCRLYERRETEAGAEGQLFAASDLSLRVPLDADVKRKDKIEVNGVTATVDTVLTRAGYLRVALEDFGG